MESWIRPLYYITSLAGLLMVGGGVWLLYKEKIYIDRESQQVTEIETPLGKFKTNVPALALFALGFIPLIYPVYVLAGSTEQVRIRGTVKTNRPDARILVYAVIESDSVIGSGEFSLKVPALGDEYKIIYDTGPTVLEQTANLRNRKGGEVQMKPYEVILADTRSLQPQVAPVPPEFR